MTLDKAFNPSFDSKMALLLFFPNNKCYGCCPLLCYIVQGELGRSASEKRASEKRVKRKEK